MARSFRSRLLVGSLLWTMGLLFVGHALSLFLMRRGQIHVLRISPIGLVIAVFAMAVGILQVQRGMSPLRSLRARLTAVREGRESRIEGAHPNEVQPLVQDLNALLAQREEIVRRALAKAGDLAHGLKTPLALLEQEAERLEAQEERDQAAAIRTQVERMRRQVEYHLAHARAAGSGPAPGARSSVSECAEGLSRTLRRLHADRGRVIDLDVPGEHVFRGETEDLHEMLGNLLDNACKWGKTRVLLRSELAESAGRIRILVDDDGPGLEPALREQVLARGVRADEAAPGSGIGLAIVHELAVLYGGSIALEPSPQGGLRARLELPGGE